MIVYTFSNLVCFVGLWHWTHKDQILYVIPLHFRHRNFDPLPGMGLQLCCLCLYVPRGGWLNSMRPSDAYMRRCTWSSLIQIMTCRQFGAKPLYEPMLLIGPVGKKHSEFLIGIQTFPFEKKDLKTSSAKWPLFCLGFNESNKVTHIMAFHHCCLFTPVAPTY